MVREQQILIDPDGSHPEGNFGWDPSGSIKICCSLTILLFGVGSVGIDQDLLLPDPISLRGGIFSFHLNNILLPSIKDLFVSNLSILYILPMPQVIEQSLFLFCEEKKGGGRKRGIKCNSF